MSYSDTPQPSQTPPPQKSSLKWLWILLAIIVVLMLVCAGLCVGLGFWGMQAAKQVSPLYADAVEIVKSSPEVQEQLGSPIEDGLPTQFNVQDQVATGTASYQFGVSGPEGEATVNVEGEKLDGEWEFTLLQVTFDDGTVLDLQ